MKEYEQIPLLFESTRMEERYGWNPIRWILGRPKYLVKVEIPAYKPILETDQKQDV